MLINIQYTEGDDFTVEMDTDGMKEEDVTGGKLKELIETKKNIPKKHQMLVFNQKEVKNYDLLSERKIGDRSKVILVFTSGICSGCEHCNPYKYESSGSGFNIGSFNVGY